MESPNPHARDMETAQKLVELTYQIVGLTIVNRGIEFLISYVNLDWFYTITRRRIIIAGFVELGGDPDLLERLGLAPTVR